MSILTVTELVHLASDGRSAVTMCGQLGSTIERPVIEQSLSITSNSVSSAAFGTKTHFIRVNCDTPCCIAGSPALGVAPTAVVGFHRLGANETAYYGVNPGDYIAVIASPT